MFEVQVTDFIASYDLVCALYIFTD